MHFGRVENADQVKFQFPSDSIRTEKFLSLPRSHQTKLYVGCPIWASRNWVGTLYPPKTKPADYLSVYSSIFHTVEVNSTFYHLLDKERISAWRSQVKPGFRFCPKVYRGISEDLQSRDLQALVLKFCEGISGFRDNLGLSFAQFAETFAPIQFPFLKKFLSLWPHEIPLAIELRHPHWFLENTLKDEVVDFFYRHRVSTVITDTAGRQDVLHFSLTQPKVLIRFQGNEGHASEKERLHFWGERIRKWSFHALDEIYFFTHQPEDQNIPETAFKAQEAFLEQPFPRPIYSADQLELI